MYTHLKQVDATQSFQIETPIFLTTSLLQDVSTYHHDHSKKGEMRVFQVQNVYFDEIK